MDYKVKGSEKRSLVTNFFRKNMNQGIIIEPNYILGHYIILMLEILDFLILQQIVKSKLFKDLEKNVQLLITIKKCFMQKYRVESA